MKETSKFESNKCVVVSTKVFLPAFSFGKAMSDAVLLTVCREFALLSRDIIYLLPPRSMSYNSQFQWTDTLNGGEKGENYTWNNVGKLLLVLPESSQPFIMHSEGSTSKHECVWVLWMLLSDTVRNGGKSLAFVADTVLSLSQSPSLSVNDFCNECEQCN